MKKKFLILILLSISGAFGFTQPLILDWQNCFGGPTRDIVYDITATNDGYLIACSTIVIGLGYDVYLIKSDLDGNLLWEKNLGGSYSEEAFRIIPTENGNYLVAGGSSSVDGDISYNPYPGSLNYWLFKINSTGDIIWDKIAGGNSYDVLINGEKTSDGGIIGYGYTVSDDGDKTISYGSFDAWMVKLDSLGQKVWDFTIGTSGGDFSTAIKETSDKGVLVSSISYIESSGNIECMPLSSAHVDIVLFKLDSVANVQWQHCYGGTDDEQLLDILEVSDGYILASEAFSDDGDVTGAGYHMGYDNSGNRTCDFWLMKIDFDGNIIWSRCYGGTKRDSPKRLFPTKDGGYIVFGNTYSVDGDVTGNHSSGTSYNDIWVIKISSTGELVWQQCIGGNGSEQIWYGVTDNGDGSYVIASNIWDFNSGQVECPTTNDSYQIWLIKVTDTTYVGTNNISYQESTMKVYPNPATEYVVFESQIAFSGFITVTDIYGRIITEIPVKDKKTVWDTRSVRPGVYLYQMKNSSFITTGKFMIST